MTGSWVCIIRQIWLRMIKIYQDEQDQIATWAAQKMEAEKPKNRAIDLASRFGVLSSSFHR